MLRVRRSRPGRPQIAPQQYSVTSSCMGRLKSSALGKPHELKLHVKGAIRNGVSKEEITEVFLQVAIYCGVPAAIDSFRVARETFKEMESE